MRSSSTRTAVACRSGCPPADLTPLACPPRCDRAADKGTHVDIRVGSVTGDPHEQQPDASRNGSCQPLAKIGAGTTRWWTDRTGLGLVSTALKSGWHGCLSCYRSGSTAQPSTDLPNQVLLPDAAAPGSTAPGGSCQGSASRGSRKMRFSSASICRNASRSALRSLAALLLRRSRVMPRVVGGSAAWRRRSTARPCPRTRSWVALIAARHSLGIGQAFAMRLDTRP